MTPDKMVCDCSSNRFMNKHHKHVITGDMNFVEEPNLRKLLNKGLAFRLPQARDPDKACESLKVGILDYINKISKKFKISPIIFD